MPVIPGSPYQPNIDVGAPVGYGDEESAGLMGRALAGFGGAVEKLGGALMEATDRKNAERDTYEAKIAAEEFSILMDGKMQKQQFYDPKTDSTGADARQKFLTDAEETAGEFNDRLSPRAQQIFKLERLKYSGGAVNKLQAMIAKDSVAKADESRGIYVNTLAKRAMGDIGSLQKSLDQVEATFAGDSSIDPGSLDGKVLDAKRTIVMSAIDSIKNSGGVNGMNPDRYPEAKRILDTYSDIIGVDKANAKHKELLNAASFRLTMEGKENALEKSELVKQEKKMKNNAVNSVYNEIDYAYRVGNKQMISEVKGKLAVMLDRKIINVRQYQNMIKYDPGSVEMTNSNAKSTAYSMIIGNEAMRDRVKNTMGLDTDDPVEIAEEYLRLKRETQEISHGDMVELQKDLKLMGKVNSSSREALDSLVNERTMGKKPKEAAKIKAEIYSEGLNFLRTDGTVNEKKLREKLGYAPLNYKFDPMYSNFKQTDYIRAQTNFTNKINTANDPQVKAKASAELDNLMQSYNAFMEGNNGPK